MQNISQAVRIVCGCILSSNVINQEVGKMGQKVGLRKIIVYRNRKCVGKWKYTKLK